MMTNVLKWIAGVICAINLSFSGMAQSPSFKTYTNPVIPGDHPDPTLTRVGKDFYTSGSSFNPTPVIYHSTDLVHWEVIAQPVKTSWNFYDDKPGAGCWGGHLVYCKNRYWYYFNRGSMYFVTATDPRGPWSDPVKMNASVLPYALGYDNSIFIDDTGKWYLVIKNGQPNNGIVELGDDGQPNGTVYDLNWLNPPPSYPYSWAEGPVMWKYKGYYYYSFARNAGGGQYVMRSKTLTASQSSWSTPAVFYNESDPLRVSGIFQGPNHSSPVVMADDSTSWVFGQSYARPEWNGQARQGLLNQVRYNGLTPVSDYPANRSFTAPKLPGSGIPWMVPKSDFFDSNFLNPEWSFLGQTADSCVSLTQRPGWLRLSPKPTKANTVIKIEGEHAYSLITRVDFTPLSTGAEAGLRLVRSDEMQFLKLYSTVNGSGKKTICFSLDSMNRYNNTSTNAGDTIYTAENTVGNTVWFKMQRVNHQVSGFYSKNGVTWVQVGKSITVSAMDALSANWIGTRLGLYVQKQSAFFDLFIYRDAYSPILAECPANESGTVTTTKTGNIYHLDSIHNEDWALYAGVEFGASTDYARFSKTFEVKASSASGGGIIEVWLDSIATGKKIAECTITNTGSWSTYKTFSVSVDTVRGRHDVYLYFKGSDSGRLFMLEWLNFKTSDVDTPAGISIQTKLPALMISPNPAHNEIQIRWDKDFNYFNIYNTQGQCLINSRLATPVSSERINVNFSPGIYFLMVGNKSFSETVRFVIE